MKVKVGRADVVLERGDITEYEVDAIVNAANNHLWMGAGVAGAIKRKGGTIIEEDAVRQGPIEVGDVVVTTAGNLPAGYVIHAAVMGQDLRSGSEVVQRATLATLRRAEEMRLHSLAFPAFGTGVGRMAPKESAEAMVGALRTHFSEVPESTIRRIHLVLFQDDTYQAFGAALGGSGARRVG
ncbi:MAG TPA: macro domain-containing protein [Methylomirabilota bacterium]|jgi:O-acetyl-ADP-ribose deacetylase (regulator of RNase III)|nr:macro domain-containing protein [Methylomirabilota bacterium]